MVLENYRLWLYAYLPDERLHFTVLDSETQYFEWMTADGWIYFVENSNLYRKKFNDRSAQFIAEQMGNPYNPQFSLSPDEQWIAFPSPVFDPNFLYVVRPDGSNLRFITPTLNKIIYDTFWSPDSQWIYFFSCTRERLDCNIYRIRPNGNDVYDLGTGNIHMPRDWQWSPNGQWLVFRSAQYGQQINMLDVINGVYYRLADEDRMSYPPIWSADSEWIVYKQYFEVPNNDQLMRSRPDGTYQTLIAEITTPIFSYFFSPDQAWIMYQRINENELSDLFRMRLDGSEQQPAIPDSLIPQALPDQLDGYWLHVVHPGEAHQSGIYMMRPDGRAARHLFTSPCDGILGYVLLPERRRVLLHCQNNDGTRSRLSVGLDGNDIRQLTAIN